MAKRSWRIYLGLTGLVLFVVGALNFAAFIAVAIVIGGDAQNGKVEDGHYYLANHSRLTEVSRSVWTYSKLHGQSTEFTHTGMLIGFGLMFLRLIWRAKSVGADSQRSS